MSAKSLSCRSFRGGGADPYVQNDLELLDRRVRRTRP
jgi:hypothetical protein